MFRNRWVFLVLTLIVALLIAVPASAEQSAITTTSRGSGFIVCSSGYILTNYHVVKGATEIEVWMNDGTRYKARLVDYSPTLDEGGYDVALIKIEASSLPALALGDSDGVQLFDEVIAMGYPLTFTLGVQLNVSGGNITSFRKWPEGPQLFQIDAAINPGNSGGPLLNARGEAIAIPTLGITQLEEEIVQGVNFAIPINYAIPVLRSIPAFDTARIGQATEQLSPQEIVSRYADAVVFIEVEIEPDLQSLIPDRILGYTMKPVDNVSLDTLRKEGFSIENATAIWGSGQDWEVWVAAILFGTPEDAKRASEAGIIELHYYEPGRYFVIEDSKLIEVEPWLTWSYGVGNGWNTGEWRIAKGVTILYRTSLRCGEWDPPFPFLNFHFSSSATSLRSQYAFSLAHCYYDPVLPLELLEAYFYATFDGISCLQIENLLVLAGVRWDKTWTKDLSNIVLRDRCTIEEGKVVKYSEEYLSLEDALKGKSTTTKEVLVTSEELEELLSEFTSVAEYVYEYVLSKF